MEPSRRPLIEVEHVFVTYPGTERHILNDCNLTLYKGEHAVIRGGNGAGKSTLLRLLRGEQWPDQIDHRRAGRVLWHGPEGADSSPLTGRKVTSLVSAMQQERVVHQEWRVDGERLVLGGFSDAIYIAQQPTPEMCETAYQLVRLLGGVHLLKKPVTAMSQGQLRLMLVARALVRKPGVLLLDEVTDGLDARARSTLLDALGRASELSTLVMTTHRPETLPGWLSRQIVLENGKAVDGPMLETAAEPEKEPVPVAGAPELKGIRGCSARITIKDASVFIDRVPVLHDINWTINPGENWAVLGGNGAGKSTLLRLLAGDEIVAYGGEIVRELPRQGGVVDRLEVLRKGVRLVSDRQQATYTTSRARSWFFRASTIPWACTVNLPGRNGRRLRLSSHPCIWNFWRNGRSVPVRPGSSAVCSLPAPLPGSRISCCLTNPSQASTPHHVMSFSRCSTSLRGRACR